MKKFLIVLFTFIGSFSFSQEYDFQEMCLACAAADGYYCGDDPANWTQYAPMGCVQNSWINDGWEDCVDAGDENGSVPTSPQDCAPPPQECDTIYVDVPVIEYVTEYDTIVEYETVIEMEYVYVTDTVYMEIFVIDTVIEIEYMTEYIDCDSGLPCNSGMQEILDKSKQDNLMYDLYGRVLIKPEGVYIQDGKIKYRF